MTYDAIIVLANEMDKDGVLNTETRHRLEKAAELYKDGAAPRIVTSGWAYYPDIPLSLAQAMRNHAVEFLDVAPSDILMNETSRDTVGDAVFSKRDFATQYDWNRILVVTSAYHQARALKIFEFIYGQDVQMAVDGVPPPPDPQRIEAEEASLAVFFETFQGIAAGDDREILKRLYEQHPLYNGDVHPT